MDRLTGERHGKLGFHTYNGEKNPYDVEMIIGELAGTIEPDYSPKEILQDVFSRLAAYEDTGLMPEKVHRLQRERSVLQAWVDDLPSGMYVNCVYCGHRYGPDDETPVSMAEVLRAHVEQCEKHPMSALRAENERLQKRLDAAVADLGLAKHCQTCKWVAAVEDAQCLSCRYEWRGNVEVGHSSLDNARKGGQQDD